MSSSDAGHYDPMATTEVGHHEWFSDSQAAKLQSLPKAYLSDHLDRRESCRQSDETWRTSTQSAAKEVDEKDAPYIYGGSKPNIDAEIRASVLLGRYGLLLFICAINTAFTVVILLTSSGTVSLAIIVVFKARDILSILWQTAFFIFTALLGLRQLCTSSTKLEEKAYGRRIEEARHCAVVASLIPVYKESTEEIAATLDSLTIHNKLGAGAQQIPMIVTDGFPIEYDRLYSTRLYTSVWVSYTTFKGKLNTVRLHLGLRFGQHVVILEKGENAGKKDTLILAFDIFNVRYTPYNNGATDAAAAIFYETMTAFQLPTWFDRIMATDADTIIAEGSLQALLDKFDHSSDDTVAACGLVTVDFDRHSGKSLRECGLWHFWDHFQGFQYLYGQWVRRRCESTWGRVTCLPGAITMFRTGPHLAGAIHLYRKPVESANPFERQVQYLGTDRRLTWCLLSQGKQIRTVLETRASCSTEPPQSLSHYLSQRKRWGSNAFFNAFFTALGSNQHLVTRAWMLLELLREGFVFFRLFNFAHFLYSLITSFDFMAILPLLVVSMLPQIWFLLCVALPQRRYRQILHHLTYGELVNRTLGILLSPVVFTVVLFSFGSLSWGRTGGVDGGIHLPKGMSSSRSSILSSTAVTRDMAQAPSYDSHATHASDHTATEDFRPTSATSKAATVEV